MRLRSANLIQRPTGCGALHMQEDCSNQPPSRHKPTHTACDGVMMSCLAEEYGLSGLFGAFPMEAKLLHGQDDPTTWNDMQQVFPKDGFAELYRAFKASHAAGDAHVFARTYEVGLCAHMHIPRLNWQRRHTAACWSRQSADAATSLPQLLCQAGLSCE